MRGDNRANHCVDSSIFTDGSLDEQASPGLENASGRKPLRSNEAPTHCQEGVSANHQETSGVGEEAVLNDSASRH